MWFKESDMYFCNVENFAYGEINERSFSNPHPWMQCCIYAHRFLSSLSVNLIQKLVDRIMSPKFLAVFPCKYSDN